MHTHTHTHAQDQPSCKPMLNIFGSGCDKRKEIDMNNVTVTPQIDTVATGGTVAGIGYTTTPSV